MLHATAMNVAHQTFLMMVLSLHKVFEAGEKQGSRKQKSELVEMIFGKVVTVMLAFLCKIFSIFFSFPFTILQKQKIKVIKNKALFNEREGREELYHCNSTLYLRILDLFLQDAIN